MNVDVSYSYLHLYMLAEKVSVSSQVDGLLHVVIIAGFNVIWYVHNQSYHFDVAIPLCHAFVIVGCDIH